MNRRKNKSVVLLISAFSFVTYALFPPSYLSELTFLFNDSITLGMAARNLILLMLKTEQYEFDDTYYWTMLISMIFSISLLFFWSNMNIRIFKNLSNAVTILIILLMILVIS